MNPAVSRSFVIGLFVLAALVLWSRMPDRLVHGYLWAEDGLIFIRHGYGLGWRAVFQPYSGYLHVLPRLLAWFASLIVEPAALPKAFAWMSACVTAAGMACIGATVARYLPWQSALGTALTPLVVLNTGEVWLSIANLQWVTALVLAVLLFDIVARPHDVPSCGVLVWCKAVCIAILMTTGPFGVLLGAFTIGALAFKRRFGSIRGPEGVSVVCAFAVQTMVLIFCPLQFKYPKAHSLHDFIGFEWIRGLLRFLLVDFFGAGPAIASKPVIWVIVAVALLGFLVACVFLAQRRWRMTVVSLLAFALIFWILGVVRTDDPQMSVETVMQGNRYSYLPFVFSSWALLICATTGRNRWAKATSATLFGFVLLHSATSWRCEVINPARIERLTDGSYQFEVPPSAGWNFSIRQR